jgi:hypothetical protein
MGPEGGLQDGPPYPGSQGGGPAGTYHPQTLGTETRLRRLLRAEEYNAVRGYVSMNIAGMTYAELIQKLNKQPPPKVYRNDGLFAAPYYRDEPGSDYSKYNDYMMTVSSKVNIVVLNNPGDDTGHGLCGAVDVPVTLFYTFGGGWVYAPCTSRPGDVLIFFKNMVYFLIMGIDAKVKGIHLNSFRDRAAWSGFCSLSFSHKTHLQLVFFSIPFLSLLPVIPRTKAGYAPSSFKPKEVRR